ncbi:MAG TPA: AcvB/VirJ family lysyl-phosphatidylglycerol hydrolase [Myxococcota bacterium]|nr:AcvB/VirJ family lysyl-phosphatidylglycerol hydrolase [Myxococcota bacterium]
MLHTRNAPRRAVRVGLAIVLVAVACSSGSGGDEREEGRFGRIRIFRPDDPPHALVFLFSDESGWSRALGRAAQELVADGAAVVGVDLAEYERGLRESDDGCHYLLSEIEDLSQRLQREMRVSRYHSPILAGIGAGGTLAYAALAQSPAATVAGAVSVDPAKAVSTKVALCEGAPSRPGPKGHGFSYGPRPHLPGWWRVDARNPLAPKLAALADPHSVIGKRRSTGTPEERLVALLRPILEAPETEQTLDDLPLIEIPADKPGGDLFAVIYSGDGGWRDLDKEIGERLAQSGVPVVGVDSLRYFWEEQSPDQMAKDLAAILEHYREAFGAKRAILIGYSFGASVLPFAVNRLPESDRKSIALIALLGLEGKASFEIKVTGWLGATPSGEGALDVLPELLRIDPALIQCFYGEEEEDSLCPDPALSKTEIVKTGGGHHFDGDYDALARRILEGARRRVASLGHDARHTARHQRGDVGQDERHAQPSR